MSNVSNELQGATQRVGRCTKRGILALVRNEQRDALERKSKAGRLLLLVPCVALASFACSQHATSNAEGLASTVQADVLGTAGSFGVLGASTVTNTGPSTILGDLGLSPGTQVTGFPPGLVIGATHIADGPAAQGQIALTAALTTLQNQPCQFTLANAELGGSTLTPGVYCFTSPSAGLTGALTLDFQGQANAVFVFKIASTLTTASNSSVVRINGGSDCNIFFELGSSATLGTGTMFRGNILATASITATTGATVSGRLLANTGAVTLDNNVISACADSSDAGAVDAGHDSATGDTDAAPDTSTGGNDAGADTSPDACTADANQCGTCGVTQTCCGAACVDVSSDSNNCGACGNVCGTGNCCHSGVCTPLP